MTDILIGRNDSTSVSLDPRYGNRHGMIAGATGTGKSVSLMVLAEGFSKLGVPCFLADVKGDLAGLAMAAGAPGDKLKARLDKLKLTDWKPQANPVVFWDLYGKLGGDFFNIGNPRVTANNGNTGTGSLTATYGDLGKLDAQNVVLQFDGSNWKASRADTGANVPLTGTGTVFIHG